MNVSEAENKSLYKLKVSGTGAKKLLQGQLTCDLEAASSENSLLGALCNPQGRIISVFRLSCDGEDYSLQMPQDVLALTLSTLQKYAVFFKVSLDPVIDSSSDFAAWKEQNITLGIPSVYAATSGLFLPHDINLPQLHGVSFQKGCYTGQEIIARMHYRGQLKKHMYRATVNTAHAPLPGDSIYHETECGTIVDSYEDREQTYQLLVVAHDADVNNKSLFLDTDKKDLLTFLPLPYALTL